MSIKEFDSLLKGNNAIRINEEYIIFNDYELLESNKFINEIILME